MEPQGIIILGMHRSGTSAFAGALGRAGLQLPARSIPIQPDNPTGFYEPASLQPLNDRALARLGTCWYGLEPTDHAALEPAVADGLVRDLTQALASEFPGSAPLILKDPRVCRLMPLWDRVLARARITARILLPLRDPFHVAASLKARNGFPIEFGLALWLRHVLDAERTTRQARRLFVRYRDLLERPVSTIERISATLIDGWTPLDPQQKREIEDFINPKLDHELARRKVARTSSFQPWLTDTMEAHDRLFRDPADSEAFRRLDDVRRQFDAGVAPFSAMVAGMAATIDALVAPTRPVENSLPDRQRSIANGVRDSLRRIFEANRA